MNTPLQEKIQMKTMVDCTNMLDKLGFTSQFKALSNGLKSLKTNQIYSSADIKIVNFYRFEGESDPCDNSILYALESANGERGTLTDAFGPYSDTNVTNFIQSVEEIQKKVNKHETL
ncbi:hypothetical protein BH11BAC2_BH11BAC2_20110 [soil metagenome]